MRKSIKVPIEKIIDMLNKISSGGRLCRTKTIQSNNSKISFLFKHEISAFYSHYSFTRYLLINSTGVNVAVNYQKLFKKYIYTIFSMFFKIKVKSVSNKRKILACFVKYLPNYRLLIKTKKLIAYFTKEEERKFNLSKIRKNMFIINSFLDTDNESVTDEDSNINVNNSQPSINNDINNTDENC